MSFNESTSRAQYTKEKDASAYTSHADSPICLSQLACQSRICFVEADSIEGQKLRYRCRHIVQCEICYILGVRSQPPKGLSRTSLCTWPLSLTGTVACAIMRFCFTVECSLRLTVLSWSICCKCYHCGCSSTSAILAQFNADPSFACSYNHV